jgi:hypothetical protein
MIYLLHFDTPLAHARHYVGFSTDRRTLPERLEHHRKATSGVRIMQVLKERGITFTVAGVWEGDRTLERKLHRHGKTRWCPICNPKYKPRLERLT